MCSFSFVLMTDEYKFDCICLMFYINKPMFCEYGWKEHVYKINTTDATSGAGTAYPSGAPEFTLFLVEFVFLDL